MPVLIGEGIPFFDGLDKDVALHLVEVKAYTSGMVALRHEAPAPSPEPPSAKAPRGQPSP